MKIFYAVQATGNGHISRAIQLLPYLRCYGHVDVFLSGSNSQLYNNSSVLPVKYRSKGLSLFYNQRTGRLDYYKIGKNANLLSCYREAKDLPVEKYDWVINDFDFITSLACKIKGKPCTGMGHQASFAISKKVPLAHEWNPFGKFILKNYAPCSDYVGFHFKQYDKNIFSPIIRQDIIGAEQKTEKHITVYLPQYSGDKFFTLFQQLTYESGYTFHVFDNHLVSTKYNNLIIKPVDKAEFGRSMLNCSGLITAAGFETPSEALFLGKKLMVVPIRGQYEQQCNAQALHMDFGVQVIDDVFTHRFKHDFWEWLDFKKNHKKVFPANPSHVIEHAYTNRTK